MTRTPVAAGPGSRVGLDVRLLVPALASWATLVGLQWAGASVVAIGSVAFAATSVGLGCLVAATARNGRRTWIASLGLTAVAIALVTTCCAGHEAWRSVGAVRDLAASRATVEVVATVASEPRPVRSRPIRQHARGQQVVVRLDVHELTSRGEHRSVNSPVLAVADAQWLQLNWRERIRATGRLSPAQAGDEVIAVLRPRGTPIVVAEPPSVVRAADTIRDRFRAATAGLPSDPAGLVPALVIGDTTTASPDLTDAMLQSGLSHLSAVSGSNVAIVLGAVLGIARVLGLPRRTRPWVAFCALVGFVVVVHPEPSVLRAAVMGAVGLVGLGTARNAAAAPGLAAAIIGLLCWDPWLARSYGFALSVLATLGLIVFARPWGERLGRRLPARISAWGPALMVPVAAQLACAPVLVLLQGSVSLVAVPANLLAGPLVAPATIAGVVVAVLALIWLPGAAVLAWTAGLPAWGIAWIARLGADQGWGSVPWPSGPTGAVLLAVLTGILLFAGPVVAQHVRTHPTVAGAVLFLVLGGVTPVPDLAWPPSAWRFVACAVGQGDALVLATGPGHAVLVDAGPEPQVVDACLDRLDVRELDAIVLTHFHADHVMGLTGAAQGRAVHELLTSPVTEPPEQAAEVAAWAAAAGVPVRQVHAGELLRWPGLTARVWWPARIIRDGSVANNASIVLAAEVYGSGRVPASDSGVGGGSGEAPATDADPAQKGPSRPLRIVLLGDIEQEAARAIARALRSDPQVQAWPVDVVKVAHHGSANRDDTLLDMLPAPVAVITVGADNDYGHPAPSTLAVLRRRGYTVLRTDQHGDIAITPAGEPGVVHVATRGP
ncbi:MAG: competence protein ComEC [Actinomycetales bacterium]|nr:MAG: competence protein ComEC [Actinomycetales bacterium]